MKLSERDMKIAKELNEIEACDFNSKEEAIGEFIKILKRNGVSKENLHTVPYSIVQPYMAQVKEM